MRKTSIVLLAAILIASAPSVHAQRRGKAPAQNGEMLAQSCLGCHGPRGASVLGPMPSIGGQNEAYLDNTLRAFRDNARPGTVMPMIMKGYSDGEIKAIAAHLAKYTWKPAAQNVDAAAVETGKKLYAKACKDCHGNAGRESAEGEYPLLAGQWLSSLRLSVAPILSGKHKVDSKFEAKIGQLTAQEVDAVLTFFAAQQ